MEHRAARLSNVDGSYRAVDADFGYDVVTAQPRFINEQNFSGAPQFPSRIPTLRMKPVIFDEGCKLPQPTYSESPSRHLYRSEAVEVISQPILPTDAKVRKSIPVYSGFFKYFPRAILAVAELSRIGNDQHNPGEPLHWAREKSGDELDACGRHLLEAGTIDTDGVRHSTKVAWRAMANLEKELENAQS